MRESDKGGWKEKTRPRSKIALWPGGVRGRLADVSATRGEPVQESQFGDSPNSRTLEDFSPDPQCLVPLGRSSREARRRKEGGERLGPCVGRRSQRAAWGRGQRRALDLTASLLHPHHLSFFHTLNCIDTCEIV